MTGMDVEKWNLLLAHCGIVFFFLTTLFITICQIVIKVFFNLKETVCVQRYKSILSFKVLRIILALFFFLPFWAIPSFFALPDEQFKKLRVLAVPLPFLIAIVGNIILLVYLVGNKEAWEYLVTKVRSYKEEVLFGWELKESQRKHKARKLFLDAQETGICLRNMDKTQKTKFHNVYVIDLENMESNQEESSI